MKSWVEQANFLFAFVGQRKSNISHNFAWWPINTAHHVQAWPLDSEEEPMLIGHPITTKTVNEKIGNKM
jgi:hypothetical protein